MPYLAPFDFKKSIQIDNLNQVINNTPSILSDAILDSQEVAKEHLVQKYYIDNELQDLDIYDNTETSYVPGSRVYLDANPYDASKTYVIGVLTLINANVYECNTTISTPESFNSGHWTLLGSQYEMFYIPYPNQIFDINGTYKAGDVVFWKGKNYTNIIGTSGIDHTTILQFQQYSNVPFTNIFPDDPTSGLASWGSGTVVTVAAGLLPDSPWKQGDNRNRSLVRHLIAITLWIIHDRIAPRNVPELRSRKYEAAMKWLKAASEGEITADIQKIQPRSGGRIRFGGQIKNINTY